jgi:membrane-bound lytic murein transglycosylase B
VRRIALIGLLLLAVVPAPAAARPAVEGPAAADYGSVRAALSQAVDRWRDRGSYPPPADVQALAEQQQRIVARLANRPVGFRRALVTLAPAARAELRDLVLARRELTSIHSVVRQRPRILIGRPEPAARLREHYTRAWRRFGVGWPTLAAVNFVESRFGRLRNESVSGARGPMQFMPATWAAYGLGGNVRDPRDAILGAANHLHANGAPGDEARALFHYNPSSAYVSAVRRYARRFRADERAFFALYAWEVAARR